MRRFKRMGQMLVSAVTLCPVIVFASVFHGSIGAFAWHQNPSGHIRYDKNGVSGTNVDLKAEPSPTYAPP